jgi:hypothetical protein
MANNTSTFTLKLKTEGMDSAQKQSQNIRDNLEGAQKAASATRVARSAAAQPTGRAGASAGVFTGTEVEDYNRASGAAGKAGGTARDFADQARGLGGLVRLYATVAANAFAAAAAFGALSRAMDTTNMVKGLDQLGAASGVALGNLSKRLFLATDGAVSLREAMEATAKASGAGLSSDQILKLGEVAKRASQTLGVNMTDALSRLSRGITKLEPELLDELGIFVKIDDAASKYALSVGKSTSALTDFERRQAFANAVLEQGNKKFGEINIDINPYTKLAATFQNLTQTILEFINKGLAPVAQIFADNSVLLGAAFAFIATKVLKMAIPALGEWQTQLVKTAQTAKEKAQAINTAFGEAWVDRWETRLKLPELRAGVKTATDELRKIALPADASKNVQAGYQTLLRGEELSKTQVAATTRAMSTKRRELEALGEVQDKQSKKQKAALEKEISSLERIIALNKQRQALSLAEGKIETAAGAQPGILSGEATRNRIAKGASTTAIALAELAAIPSQTMEKGFGDAMKNMKANLEKQGVGFVKRWSTLAVGALASATAAIGTFIASITMWIGVFMAVGFAIYGALKYFSATKKESQLTSEAITRLDDASKSAALTLEKMAMSKDPLDSLNVQTIQARANALKELGDSAALAVKRAFDEISKMNVGDKFLNWVAKLWSGDVQTKLSEGLADSIKNSFRLAEDTKLTQEAKKSIETILGTSVQSADLDKIIKKVAASGDDGKLKQIVKIIESMGNAAAVSAAKGTELKESFAKVTTGIQEFNRSVLPTDNLSKIAQDSAVAAQKLGLALGDPVQALTAMRDVSNSVDMLSIFPPEVAKTLMNYNSELTTIAQRTAAAKKATEDYDKQILELSKDIKLLDKPTVMPGSQTEAKINELKAEIEKLEGKKVQLKVDIQTDTSKIRGVFDEAVRASLIQSADLMAARLAAEMNKARTAVMSTIAGLLGDTAGGIKMRADIEKQAVDASVEVAQQSFNLGTKMEELKIEMERKRLQDEQIFLMSFRSSDPDRAARLDQIAKSLENLDKLEGVIKSGFKGPGSQQLARQGATPEMVSARQRFEGYGVTLAGAKAQKESINIKTEVELERNRFQQRQKDFQLSVDIANAEKQRLETLSNIYGIENLALLNRKIAQTNIAQELADTKQRNELQQSVNEKADLYTKAIVSAAKSGKSLTEEQKKNFTDSILQADAEVKRFDKSLELRNKARDVADELSRIDSRTASEQKKLDLQSQRITLSQDLQQIVLDSNKREFEGLNSIGALTEEYAAKRTAQLAKEAQQLQYNRQLQDAAAQKALLDIQAQAQASKAVATGMDPAAAAMLLETKMSETNALYVARVQNINSSNSAALRSIDIETSKALEVAKTNKLLEDQKDRSDTIANIGDLLTTTFGKAGTVIMGVVNALEQISVTQDSFNQKLQQQNEIQAKAAKIMDDPNFDPAARADAAEAYNKAEREKGKLTTKNARDEMVNNTKLVGSVKNMFKEKTAAYKIFNAVERAMHVYTLAMDVAKVASGWMVTTQKVAQAQVQTAAQAAPAGASAAAQTPGPVWTKIAAGLAAFAFVMSLASGGKGGSAPTPGTSAADRQETQGTGMTWKDGQKVETGGGVFGDSEAKSNSIRDSLEMIKDNSVDGLSYNNEMVNLLASIDRSIGKAAVGLFGVKGLRAGTAFNTVEGSSSGGGLLGTGLFSSKTTSQIADSGILVKGSFRQLAGEIDGAVVQLYEDVTKTKKTWYGKTKSWTERSTTEMPEALQYINDIFSKSTELFINLGSQLDMGSQEIYAALDSLGNIDFEGSLRGLKGEEFENELQALISTQLGNASRAIFGTIVAELKQFGEDALQTVVRVLDQTEKVNQVLKNLNVAAPTDRLQNIRFADTLVELSGGIEEFVNQNRFFTENFLTDAERLAPVQKAVTEELGRLNLSFVDTREEFKAQVIASLALGDAGAELYAALMRLAPGFAEVYKEAEKLTELSTADFASRVNQTRVKALDLISKISGKESDAIAVVTLQRELELAELDKYPDAQKQILIANQKYLYALEDELSAKDKLVKRRDLLKTTIDNISKAVDALANYKKTLLAGDLSVLLPVDKYQQAKTQFEDLLTTINKTPTTEAEKAAQLDAVNKLPQVSDAFLQASRQINASSGAYTSDFESVTRALDATSGILTGQKTDAEKQLDAIKAQGISLESIAESSATTAALIDNFLKAQANTNTLRPTTVIGTDVPVDVKSALNKLADEFKLFRGEVKDALNGPGNSVTSALTGQGGVKDALTGTTNSVAAEIKTSRTTSNNQTAAVVEAVVTSGGSVAETVAAAVVDSASQTTYERRTNVIIGKYNLRE